MLKTKPCIDSSMLVSIRPASPILLLFSTSLDTWPEDLAALKMQLSYNTYASAHAADHRQKHLLTMFSTYLLITLIIR